VRPVENNPEEYIIITGERRYRASKIVGLASMPCIIHPDPMTITEIRAIQLIENLQREDLNIIEKARGFDTLMKDGMSQREVARTLGLPEGTISKSVTILKKLPEEWIAEIEKLCRERTDMPLYQIYEVAKEKNPNRKRIMFDRLLKGIPNTASEEESLESQIEQAPKEGDVPKSEQEPHEEEIKVTSDEIWEALKKIVRKDKEMLRDYFSTKKLKKLLERTPYTVVRKLI
jgi:ParB family chromosome partitioning protein